MHEGDVYLDGESIVVVTDSSSQQGRNQYNELCNLSENATKVLTFKDVLSQFREAICKAAT